MRSRWYGWLVLGLLAAMPGCAGDSASPNDDDDDGDPSEDEQRIAAIESAIDQITKLTGATADERRQQMVAWLQARPEFEAAGAEEDGSVWARFHDGRPFVIVSDRDPLNQAQLDSIVADFDPTGAAGFDHASAAPGPPNELPKAGTARFYLGGEPQSFPTAIPVLKQMVTSRGYTIAPNAGIGGVDDLKKVSGYAIFYWTSHGGSVRRKDGSSAYAILTATRISVLNDLRYIDDWNNLRLGYSTRVTRSFLPSWGVNDSIPAYYAITKEFVTKHMSFAKDSFLYIAACSALAPASIGMAQAFAAKGGVVAGWTSGFTSGKDAQTAMYVFDRLLGANMYQPESPRQRPFDYKSLKLNMGPHDKETISVGQGVTTESEFYFIPGSNGTSGLLAPSIQHMVVDETTGKLILTGKFGSEMGQAEVDGVSRPVLRWTPETVEIDIPLTGRGSSGNVVVISQNRRSNSRPLTDWRGDFIWTFPSGQGSLRWDGLIRVHFRADVHTFREEHRQQPKHRLVSFTCARDTDGEVTASGSSGTTSWTGTAQMKSKIATGAGPNTIDCMGEIDTELKKLRLFLVASAQSGLSIIQDGVSFGFPVVWAYGDGPLLGGTPLPSMYMDLSQVWNVVGDHRMLATGGPSQRLDWGTIVPTHIPADSTAR